MKLPHGKTLLFAKEILSRDEKSVKVKCVFPYEPTLAMFVEAAAQSSVGFDIGSQIKIGFLTLVNDVKLLEVVAGSEYLLHITKDTEVQQYKKFTFSAYHQVSNDLTASGNFTLLLS